MKMMKSGKLLAAALTICTMGMWLAMPASAQRQFEDCIQNCKVYDVQDVLTDEEESTLTNEILETSSEIDMYIAVYIYGEETYFGSDLEVEATADDRYDALFNPEAGTDTDGVLLLINNSTKYDYLSTSGMGQLYYYNGSSDNRSQALAKALVPFLEVGDYSGAIRDFLENLVSYYEMGIPDHAYTYNESNGMYHYAYKGELRMAESLPFWFGKPIGVLIAVPIVTGLLAALIAFFAIRGSYQKKLPLSPTSYVSRKNSHFTVQQDMFLRKNVTKQYIDRDSGGVGGVGGGGGGGLSHMSSGGHSHGGGGNHR